VIKNYRGQINFDNEMLKKISYDGFDLIQKLLKVNPSERLSVSEALQHK